MAPNNRRNPDVTDASGHFGWDVVPGYYKVQAEKAGCKGAAESRVLVIPPPVLDLDLRIDCPYKPKLALGPLRRGTFAVSKRGKTRYRLANLSPFKVRGKVAVKVGRRTLGGGRFSLRANRPGDATVKLNRAGRRRLRKGRAVKVTVVVRARGAGGSKATARRAVKLRRR
jgi:hypothetical protein